MKVKIPQAEIKFINKKEAVLTKDLIIKFDGLTFIIKKGYKTDGASIPKQLWSLGGASFSGDTLSPAIFHDVMYESELYSRTCADNNFLFLMRNNGVSWIKRTTYFLAVRLFGWGARLSHTVGSVENARQFLVIKRLS